MPALATSSESRGAPTVLALPPSKQYASVLAPRPSTSTPTWVPEYRLSMKDGIPAIRFSPHDLLRSEQIMAFSLILKFSAGRPPLNDIKAHIELHWGLTGKYVVGLIDPRHILLRLSSELEVTKVLVREKKHIQGYWFRIFRWSSSFNPKKESSLAPVWVLIPRLPMNYFSNEMMHGIAERIGGRLLKVDNPTLGHSRPSVARICLEIDLAKPITESIWFWSSKDEGFEQDLVYEFLPKFCKKCSLQGHDLEDCKKGKKSSSTSVAIGEDEPDKAQEINPKGGTVKIHRRVDNGKEQTELHLEVGGSKEVDEDGFQQVMSKNGWRKKIKQVSFQGESSDSGEAKLPSPAITMNNNLVAIGDLSQQLAVSSIANMEEDGDHLPSVVIAGERPQSAAINADNTRDPNSDGRTTVPTLNIIKERPAVINHMGVDYQANGLPIVTNKENISDGGAFISGGEVGGPVLVQQDKNKQFNDGLNCNVSGGALSKSKQGCNILMQDGGTLLVEVLGLGEIGSSRGGGTELECHAVSTTPGEARPTVTSDFEANLTHGSTRSVVSKDTNKMADSNKVIQTGNSNSRLEEAVHLVTNIEGSELDKNLPHDMLDTSMCISPGNLVEPIPNTPTEPGNEHAHLLAHTISTHIIEGSNDVNVSGPITSEAVKQPKNSYESLNEEDVLDLYRKSTEVVDDYSETDQSDDEDKRRSRDEVQYGSNSNIKNRYAIRSRRDFMAFAPLEPRKTRSLSDILFS